MTMLRCRDGACAQAHVYPDLHPDCAPALALLEAGCKEDMEDAVDVGEGGEHEPGDGDGDAGEPA